jgi:hypothetical protein
MPNILALDAEGNFSILQNGVATPTPASPTPYGCAATGMRPSSRVYQGRRYIVGSFNPGVCYDEYGNFTAIGVPPPSNAPTLSAVAPVGTGLTGNMIGYITFAYKIGNVVIAESNPTSPTAIVAFTNQGAQWSNLPTICGNPKANVIRGYRSVAGAVPSLAWERPIGTTSVFEEVPTGALGDTLPVDDNGNLTFSHGLPPASANIIEVYHDRTWYNDPANPYYCWYSEIGAPEAVGALNFIPTRDREPVTAINRVNDVLVVQGASVTYDIQGYTVADFTMQKLTSSIGCINNSTVVNINEVLWFLSQDGAYTYNGATFRFMMKTIATFFRTDYLANRALYENAFAADDRYDHLYKILLPVAGSPTRPNYLICPYVNTDPAMAGLYGAAPGSQGFGAEPMWFFDNRQRVDYTMLQALAPGTSRADFYVASQTDGYIRQENVETDGTDDGDAGNKTFSLTHGHNLLKMPQGDDKHGKKFQDLDIFAVFELVAAEVNIWTGDESAATAGTDQAIGGGLTLGPTKVTVPTPLVPLEDQYQQIGIAGAVGRGYTLQIVVPNAVGTEYRGHALTWESEAPQSRSPVS